MARYCTIPEIFGLRDWFEARFAEHCKRHDERYQKREVTKLQADLELAGGMVAVGRCYIPLAVATFVFCWSPIGLWYWFTE